MMVVMQAYVDCVAHCLFSWHKEIKWFQLLKIHVKLNSEKSGYCVDPPGFNRVPVLMKNPLQKCSFLCFFKGNCLVE